MMARVPASMACGTVGRWKGRLVGMQGSVGAESRDHHHGELAALHCLKYLAVGLAGHWRHEQDQEHSTAQRAEHEPAPRGPAAAADSQMG